MNYQIQEDLLNNFSPSAKTELLKKIDEYTKEFVREAERLEKSYRNKECTPEITAMIIQHTSKNSTTSQLRKRNSSKNISQGISTISIFIAGLLFDTDKFSISVYWILAFITVTIIAITATIYIYMVGDK